MRTKHLWEALALFLCAFIFIGCSNDDEERFSKEEVQQALFDMKGAYHGAASVSHYQGPEITELQNAIAVSRDSLQFSMSLLPYAELMKDEVLSKLLKEVGDVEVKAGYEFLQMDGGVIHFVLHPKDVNVSGGYGLSSSIRIVFSQLYGGDAQVDNGMIFNLSPIELWVDGKKHEDFPRLVFHFEGKLQ